MTWPTVDELQARTVTDPDSGCWLWQGATFGRTGYGAVNRSVDGRGRVRSTHRLMWEAAYGPIPPGLMVQHTCDVRRCLNPDHLTLGTAISNGRQAAHRGRLRPLRGEASPKARLSDADVAQIRSLFAAGHSRQSIADAYGISRSYITQLVNNHRRPQAA